MGELRSDMPGRNTYELEYKGLYGQSERGRLKSLSKMVDNFEKIPRASTIGSHQNGESVKVIYFEMFYWFSHGLCTLVVCASPGKKGTASFYDHSLGFIFFPSG